MTVSLSQIQKVLQNYTKQVQRGTRLKEKESSPQGGESTVKAKISPEVKRKQVIERVASEIITHLVNREYQKESVEEQILTRLTQEYGEPLMIGQDSATGRFVFHVINQETGAKARTIDQDESTQLAQKMVDITKELVDKTML
jgi:hypothetical protein